MRPGRSAWGKSARLALPLCALLGGYALWAGRSQPRAPVESSTAAAIAPLIPAAGFSIASTPAGAQIVVDGKTLAITTPAIVGELTPGLHSVELRLAGYLSSNMPALLEPGQTLMLPSIELRPIVAAPAEVASDEPSSAAPRKPSARERRAARRASARRVKADRAEQSEGYAGRILAPNLDSETADSSSVENLAAEGGTLQINSRPWSRVFVDGRFVGHTPQRAIKLSPGKHTIRLVNDPLSMSKTLEIIVPTGETVTRVETLDEDTETSSN